MYRDHPDLVRWRVRSAQAWQEVAPGSAYWHHNRRRAGGAVLFQYTRRGALSVQLGRRRLRIPAGSAALLRFGDASSYGLDPHDRDGYVCSYLSFQGAGLMQHWQELIALHGVCVPYGHEVLSAALALSTATDGGSPERIAAQVHAFVMLLYERPAAVDGGERPATERAIAAIRADPCAARSLKEVAAAHGLSREHLARVFRQRLGEAPWAFVTRARLARAHALLADPALTVAEVARLCGYTSARVLARNLRAATGRSPADWRR